ncbi:hypothetical protein D3C86_2132170 [compost metagenome]
MRGAEPTAVVRTAYESRLNDYRCGSYLVKQIERFAGSGIGLHAIQLVQLILNRPGQHKAAPFLTVQHQRPVLGG